MSKDKKIEKMARDICCVKQNCNDVCHPINSCRALKYAERFYNAGYRKQSDVIDDFVKRLLDAFPEPHRGGNLCPAIYYDDYRYIIEEMAEKIKGGAE